MHLRRPLQYPGQRTQMWWVANGALAVAVPAKHAEGIQACFGERNVKGKRTIALQLTFSSYRRPAWSPSSKIQASRGSPRSGESGKAECSFRRSVGLDGESTSMPAATTPSLCCLRSSTLPSAGAIKTLFSMLAAARSVKQLRSRVITSDFGKRMAATTIAWFRGLPRQREWILCKVHAQCGFTSLHSL